MRRLTIFTLIAIILFLSGCEPLPPIVDERCIGYESYSFYQIEKATVIGTLTDQWILETNDGAIEVPNSVYLGSMNYEYSEICYEREDADATVYLYTKKTDSIKPEPETIIEYVDKFIDVLGPTVYTHTIMEVIQFTEGTTIVPLGDNLSWIVYAIEEEDRAGFDIDNTDPLVPIQTEWELINLQAGDIIIITILFEPHTLSKDLYWLAEITHYRFGIIQSTITYEELFTETEEDTIEEYITLYILNTNVRDLYAIMYPVEEE